MKIHRNAHVVLAAIATAAIIAPAALGAGEPKNELPFTQRSTGVVPPTHGVRLTSGTATLALTGEPKNEPPFTRPSADIVIVHSAKKSTTAAAAQHYQARRNST